MSPFLLSLPAGGALEPSPGAVLAVCGENGSGVDAVRQDVADRIAAARGAASRVAWIGSRRALAPQLDLAANIYLGHELTRRWGIIPAGIDRKRTRSETVRLLESLGCALPPHTVAGDLGAGDRVLVELARALSTGADVIVLEEPTAHVAAEEVANLHTRLRELARRGHAVVVFTQKPRAAIGYADAIAVLRDGALVGVHPVDEASRRAPEALRATVLREMVEGKVVPSGTPGAAGAAAGPRSSALLRVAGWTVTDPVEPERLVVHDAELDVGAGEVVGLAGLRNSGANALLLSLYGRSTGSAARGSLSLRGAEVDTSTVEKAIAAGLFLVTTDTSHYRVRLGGVSMPVSASALPTLVSYGLVDRDSETTTGAGVLNQALGTARGQDGGGPAERIAGLVSAFADSEREVLLLIDPTRGMSSERRAALHADLLAIASRGKSVLLVSTDLAELTTVCDRVVGMADGRITGEWDGEDALGFAELIAPD